MGGHLVWHSMQGSKLIVTQIQLHQVRKDRLADWFHCYRNVLFASKVPLLELTPTQCWPTLAFLFLFPEIQSPLTLTQNALE